MGTWASGNYSRERRQTTNELRSIHVRDIADLPLLPQFWVSPPYPEIKGLKVRGDESAVDFGVAAASNVIEIGAAGLIYTPRNFGGQQPYFQCQCGKRVTSLYLNGHSIACRHCHGLLYESQFSPKHEQPATKAAKLRARIGGGPALLHPLPERPKGMHRKTYESITYRILAYELAAVTEMKAYREEQWLPRLLKLDELAAQQ